MSNRIRASTALCRLGCAVALLAGGQVMAVQVAPPPPDLSKLPQASPVATPTAPDTVRPTPSPEPLPQRATGTDPAIQETVVEDDGARIDELKVRGRAKRIVVTPKTGPAYEIIPPGTGSDISQGARGTNGAVGKRVWPVMSF